MDDMNDTREHPTASLNEIQNETKEPTWVTDDHWQESVNYDRVNESAQALLLARGNYVTVPPMTVTIRDFSADGERPARTLYRAFGRVIWAGTEPPRHTIIDDVGNEKIVDAPLAGSCSFGFSPQEVIVTNRAGRTGLDIPSRLYIQLAKAYERAYSQKAMTKGDLRTYLETYPVKLNIGLLPAQDGQEARNMVFSIQPVIS